MKYAWLIGALIFLFLWCLIFIKNRNYRRNMLILSFLTMSLGLTEPLFVPSYWHPLSLFDLAKRTGFDIESLIFAFAIGGIGSFLYSSIFNIHMEPLPETATSNKRHRWHSLILSSPLIIFIIFALLTSLNHIYCAIIAMATGALGALYCRPDLAVKILIGGLLFLLLYFVFFFTLIAIFPDFVQDTWNMQALSGVLIFKVPLEELLFAFTFGMLWSSLYEHFYWLMDIK